MNSKHNDPIDQFTDEELKQIQISATQQMINIASTPASEFQIHQLSQIVKKCSRVTRNKR